jgi:hypothetical protein
MYQRTAHVGKLTIEWAQQSSDSAVFGRIMVPVETAIFASVSRRTDRRYLLTITPKGHSAGFDTYRHAVYLTPEKAMAHAERWVLSRWRHIPLFVCKISMVGRGHPPPVTRSGTDPL